MTSFTRNSTLNLIFNYSNIIFNVVTSVLLVPFYLQKIPLNAYGSYLVALGLSTLIGLLEFGLSMVLTQRLSVNYAKADQLGFRRTTGDGIIAAALLVSLSLVVTLVVHLEIAGLSKVDAAYAHDLEMAFVYLGATASCNILLNLFGSIFQATLRAGALGAINLVSATVGVVVAVTMFRWHPSLGAIALAPLARSICSAGLLLIGSTFYLRRESLLPQLNGFQGPLRLLKSCLPIFFGGVSRSLVENAQNLILANALSPTAIAILSLTQKAMQVCAMVLAPVGSSIYASLAQVRQKAVSSRFSELLGVALQSHFLCAVLLIAIASEFNEAFMSLWVGKEKFGGTPLSILLGASTLLASRFAFLGFLIYSTGDFRGPLKLEIGYSFAKIIVLGLLVGPWGLYSVPLAEFVAGLIFFFVLGNRLLSTHLREAVSKRHLYGFGWFEFALLNAIGYCYIEWLKPVGSWLALASLASVFFCLMTICVAAINKSFIRKALSLRNRAIG